MGNLLSPGHLVLLLLVILLLFGPNKLPELGRAFGRTLRELKEGAREVTSIAEPAPEQERTEVTATAAPQTTRDK
ncbi:MULTISPECIES: twin-arginine translocase TatA/TatE family subunit [Paenibacillus]|uniref:twin-arginine translocase TatA/TatE family subunit n=1 Tax=Paenibacillus TaxID=44249 RepID=UPI0022B861C0|nr:twin-arginine translocase TatA/TatE family subunit [Paenibacillus caseinilyticus]MCZ8521631.1 twin-arginine translocase TatA/TatE family subunit [Paenibacillus caseinilyticus]